MPKNKGFVSLVTILLALLLVGSLTAAGYLFWKNQQYQGEAFGPYTPPPTSNNQTPLPNPQDETANWKTFENTELGYSLKYPQDWYSIPGNNGEGPSYDRIQSFSPPTENVKGFPSGQVMIAVGKANNPSLFGTLDQWFNQEVKSSSYLTKVVAKVGNYNSIKTTQNEPIGRTTYYYLANSSEIYQIWVVGQSEGENSKLVDQILSTFKFTQTISTQQSSTKNEANIFDPTTVKIGARVGNMTLININPAYNPSNPYNTVEYTFQGETTISGKYIAYAPAAGVLQSIACFEITDPTSASKIPEVLNDPRDPPWFCFSNQDEALKELGPYGTAKQATIVIDKFISPTHIGEGYSSATLVKVI